MPGKISVVVLMGACALLAACDQASAPQPPAPTTGSTSDAPTAAVQPSPSDAPKGSLVKPGVPDASNGTGGATAGDIATGAESSGTSTSGTSSYGDARDKSTDVAPRTLDRHQ